MSRTHDKAISEVARVLEVNKFNYSSVSSLLKNICPQLGNDEVDRLIDQAAHSSCVDFYGPPLFVRDRVNRYQLFCTDTSNMYFSVQWNGTATTRGIVTTVLDTTVSDDAAAAAVYAEIHWGRHLKRRGFEEQMAVFHIGNDKIFARYDMYLHDMQRFADAYGEGLPSLLNTHLIQASPLPLVLYENCHIDMHSCVHVTICPDCLNVVSKYACIGCGKPREITRKYITEGYIPLHVLLQGRMRTATDFISLTTEMADATRNYLKLWLSGVCIEEYRSSKMYTKNRRTISVKDEENEVE